MVPPQRFTGSKASWVPTGLPHLRRLSHDHHWHMHMHAHRHATARAPSQPGARHPRQRRPRVLHAASPAAAADAEQASPSGRPFAPPRHSSHDGLGRLMLKNLTHEELEAWCLATGEPARRAEQLWRWMYYDQHWAASFEEAVGAQNGFSAGFAAAAAAAATLDGGLQLQQVVRAGDGTVKLVLMLTEGEGRGGAVEAVLIPAQHRTQGKLRLTLCVSSQVGCAMACQFCHTGRMGLMANLSAAQIVEQVVVALRVLRSEGAELDAITNVVFMGMGEPLHNMDSVLAAIGIMTHPRGLRLSPNKVTVSTVGLVPELQKFLARCPAAQLAVSLHATTDEVRDWVVPVNRRHRMDDLVRLLEHHFPRGGGGGGGSGPSSAGRGGGAAAAGGGGGGRKARHVLVQYTMLAGVNDTEEDAHRLVRLLERVQAKVNLIQFNPHRGTRFRASSMEAMLAFRAVLVAAGRVCTLRASRGDDEMAACGQLGDPGAPHLRGAAPLLAPPPRFEAALLPAAAAAADDV